MTSLKQQWLADQQKICLCKGVSRGVIVRAIRGGASTLVKIRQKTTAGSGCGQRCRADLLSLIRLEKSKEETTI